MDNIIVEEPYEATLKMQTLTVKRQDIPQSEEHYSEIEAT
jgi:hypothetical protein